MNQKFPKQEKLKAKSDIDLLFKKGKWKTMGNLRVISHRGAQTQMRVGVSVSKRFFKKATDRNRIKRLLRECYRLNKDMVQQRFGKEVDVMFFWASSQMPTSYQDVFSVFEKMCLPKDASVVSPKQTDNNNQREEN